MLLRQRIQLPINTANSLLADEEANAGNSQKCNISNVMPQKTPVSTGFEYRKYMGENSMAPIKITRGTNLFCHHGKEKLGVTL